MVMVKSCLAPSDATSGWLRPGFPAIVALIGHTAASHGLGCPTGTLGTSAAAFLLPPAALVAMTPARDHGCGFSMCIMVRLRYQ